MTNSLSAVDIENAIASLLLDCLSQSVDPAECAFHLERSSVDFFLSPGRGTCHAISEVVLEGFATLAAVHQDLKQRALSSLLVLGASSVLSWNSITASKIFEVNTELNRLLTMSIAGNNPSFQFLSDDTKSAISRAFISLSNYERHEDTHRLRILPTTPVSLAMSGLIRSVNSSGPLDSFVGDSVPEVLRSLPSEALASISDDDWVQVVDLALEHNVDTKCVKVRSLLNLSRDTPARAELLRVVRKHPESQIAEYIGSCDLIALHHFSLSFTEAIFSSLKDIDTAKKAYHFAKRCHLDGNEKTLKDAVPIWMNGSHFDFLAAAYLAAPTILKSAAGSNIQIYYAMEKIPECFCSPIDEYVDSHLLSLLATVPEFSRLLSRKCEDIEKSSLMGLKRIAMIHPYLFARRLPCLFSSGRTMLYGLNNPTERYGKACLRLLEVVFEILCGMPPICVKANQVREFIIETLSFVLEENRATNGVPGMFLALVLAVFKTLRLAPEMTHDSRIVDLVRSVRSGKNTSTELKEAADVFLPAL